MKQERQLWKKLKDETPSISWIRIENWALPGTPDLLGYNSNGTFFTVELKVTNRYSVRLSPHQISFHVRHKKNTFILVCLFPEAWTLPLVSWIPDPGTELRGFEA